MSKGKLQAVLLGVAQDAGVPQAGCTCQNCSEARRDYSKRQFVVCMGLVDRAVGKGWLLDYTPDFREQLYRLKEFAPECRFSGVLITHAHIGHYTGLLHLGKKAATGLTREEIEAATAADIPLHRNATEADVANAIMFFLSDSSDFLTGLILDVDGGMLSTIPIPGAAD